MFSTSLQALLAASCLLLLPTVLAKPTPVALAQTPIQSIATATYTGPRNALSTEGCFSSAQPMKDHGSYTFQSSGNCQPICLQLSMPVMGLVNGTNCWCGDLLPPANTKVDQSNCDTPCNGIDTENCGGANYWSVYLTGLTRNKIANLDPASLSSSTTGTTSTTKGVPTTVVITSTPEPTAKKSSGSSGKSNTVGIAVGVVVGIVAIAGIILGVWFFLRHKRRRDAEEEYKRQAAVNSFVNGGKAHGSNSSMNDSRLEPDILQRRESTGSIADNQDYSRRILKVRNPSDFD